ncbi:hypothetical protein Tsubulata_050641 [Turnera subulata]|uniref:Dof-type domain-containing protein n=1 Tax=Turnera subulata TaxID=218843 RepID=A0A9Q0JG79_9ROSI|nr:hypothetical protein Tsubulata_050641 [Turnera subulata]
MSSSKVMAIKLFGKRIPLSPKQEEDVPFAVKSCSRTSAAAAAAGVGQECCDQSNITALPENKSETEQENHDEIKEPSSKEITDDDKQEDATALDGKDQASSDSSENNRTASTERETSSTKSPANEEQSQTSDSQEKTTLKKPDKILPCPRCNSMETKFCYYNNYNVNQPRHFCKNCQRYWTAGGTMRNVPVGAGRRKNKSSSASHYRNIMVTEALRTAHALAMNGNSSSTVLTFGSDSSPLCESVSSVLNLAEDAQNKHHHQKIIASCGGGSADNGDDRSSGSSITASNSSDKAGNGGSSREALAKNFQGFPSAVPCFPGPHWSYPWNPAMPAPPAFCPSGFPVSFYPPPNYWGCAVPSPWNVTTCLPPPSLSPLTQTSTSPTSPLGKHSRDCNVLNPENKKERNNSERCSLLSKTPRIDDPIETAKSSIWGTLKIKTEKSRSVSGVGMFDGFQSKFEGRNYMADTSSVLQSNPAATFRSLNFHEST